MAFSFKILSETLVSNRVNRPPRIPFASLQAASVRGLCLCVLSNLVFALLVKEDLLDLQRQRDTRPLIVRFAEPSFLQLTDTRRASGRRAGGRHDGGGGRREADGG